MKKGRILLMSPNLRGLGDGIIRIQPGLGIGYVAAVTRQMGHEVFVRDTALEGYNKKYPSQGQFMIKVGESDQEISDYISNINPEVLGISVLFSNLIESGHNIARIAKEVNPKIKVVIGGNHVSNSSLDFIVAQDPTSGLLSKRFYDIEDENVDYAMRGEVDFSSAELFDALINGRDPSNIDGLIFKTMGYRNPNIEGQKVIKLNDYESVVINKKTKVANLTSLPFPARDLMNMEGYFKIANFHSAKSKSDRVLNVMCSRGCPEHCTFCTTPEQFGQTVRWRDPKNIFEEICQCSVDTDGVDFLASSVKAQKIKGDQEYEGIRITLVAKLSEAKIPLQIDIGFGDVVSPPPQLITFPTLLKFDPPKIKIYPKETVIAEKLHAIVNLGITNSRMKDFYDIWMLSKHFQFSGKELSNAIKQTFTRRKTPIPINPPLAFTAEFYNDKTKQTQWNAFVKKNQLIEGEGITLHETITQIINFLMPLIESIIQKEHFTLNWREGKWGK